MSIINCEIYPSSLLVDKGRLPWPLIGGVAGGVVFLCFVIGVVTWGVHSRRKCKKDAKSEYQS